MVTEKRVAIVEDRLLAIQELETRFAMAIRQRELLETYIREKLKPDKHFYTVGDEPGRKPSLTKEGAELICLPHNLKPRYTILSGPDRPLADNTSYQITINCALYRVDTPEGEGIGSASSYQTKKDGTHKPRQNDPGLCYNATIKMACKSAYIAACLNSTAASEFFTQDLEDDQTGEFKKSESQAKEHWCEKHHTAFFKTKNMKAYSHPVKNPDGSQTLDDNGKPLWCSEKVEPQGDPIGKAARKKIKEEEREAEPIPGPIQGAAETSPDAPGQATEAVDMDWLKESLQRLNWNDVGKYLKTKYNVTGQRVGEQVKLLSPEQLTEFVDEVNKRLLML